MRIYLSGLEARARFPGAKAIDTSNGAGYIGRSRLTSRRSLVEFRPDYGRLAWMVTRMKNWLLGDSRFCILFNLWRSSEENRGLLMLVGTAK